MTGLASAPVALSRGYPVPRKRPYEREAILPAAWREARRVEDGPSPRRPAGLKNGEVVAEV